MYLALYRKYRPKTFDEVVGQDHITQTLINQIKYDKISHAYLFTGSRGTGKTSTAKIFAKAINCKKPQNGSPCGQCEVCKALEGTNIDVLEIDAASNNGVDEIRDLREKVKYPPVVGKYKVYIIDEVHMLSASAFNALLKTLEEPPTHTVFILATTEVHKLPATILSRCLRFDFRLVSLEKLTNLLKSILSKEGVDFDDQSINAVARAGEGSVRDTLSIADRCVAFAGDKLDYAKVISVLGVSEREVLISMASKILAGQIGETLAQLDTVLFGGKSPLVFSNDLIFYFRDLLLIWTLKDKAKDIIVVRDEEYQQMASQAVAENYQKIVNAIYELSGIEQDLRYSAKPRIVLETALIKIMNERNLTERIELIEQKLKEFPS